MPSRPHSATRSRPSRLRPPVHGRRGLHVADLVDPVVHQREHGHAGRAGLLQPPRVTLQEVAALTAQQHRRATAAQPGHRVGPEHGQVGHGGQDQRGHPPGAGVTHRAGDRRSPQRRHHRVPGRKAGQEATAGMTVQVNPRPRLCDHNPRQYRPPHRRKRLPDTSRRPPSRPIPAARRRLSTGWTPSATVPIHPRRTGGGTPPVARQPVGVLHGGVHNEGFRTLWSVAPVLAAHAQIVDSGAVASEGGSLVFHFARIVRLPYCRSNIHAFAVRPLRATRTGRVWASHCSDLAFPDRRLGGLGYLSVTAWIL
jgi:hypothetical protein